MNQRVARLLAVVFNDRNERRRFRKAYTRSRVQDKQEAIAMAKKIKAVRDKGGTVNRFVLDKQAIGEVNE